MKQQLITRYQSLKIAFLEARGPYVWPVLRDMDRIKKVLFNRYNYIV